MASMMRPSWMTSGLVLRAAADQDKPLQRHGLQHIHRLVLELTITIDVHELPPGQRVELPLPQGDSDKAEAMAAYARLHDLHFPQRPAVF